MSYDFALFIPDYDVDGIAVGSRYLPENKHLMERYNMEGVPDPSAAGPLADIAEAINSQVQELEENGVLLSSDIALEGGRMLPIPVTYPSAEVAKNWLSELAVNNSLGLIDASSNLVITFGDEDPRFETITAYLSIPGFSRRGLPSLLEYVRDMLDENHFVILQRKDADQNYIQTIVDEDARQPDAWHVVPMTSISPSMLIQRMRSWNYLTSGWMGAQNSRNMGGKIWVSLNNEYFCH